MIIIGREGPKEKMGTGAKANLPALSLSGTASLLSTRVALTPDSVQLRPDWISGELYDELFLLHLPGLAFPVLRGANRSRGEGELGGWVGEVEGGNRGAVLHALPASPVKKSCRAGEASLAWDWRKPSSSVVETGEDEGIVTES